MVEEPVRSDAAALVACSLAEVELAGRSQELARGLFAFAERVEERETGYAWRFPGEGEWHAALLDFVAVERRCCSFFRMELLFEPGLGPVWLTLLGPDGTKALIRQAFGIRQAIGDDAN